MDQVVNHQSGNGRRALVPGDPAAVPDPYRRDAHVYPYYPMDLEPERNERFDVFKYVAIAIKYRWLIAGCAVAAVIIQAVTALQQTPIYQATASIQIAQEAVNVVGVGAVEPNVQDTYNFYETQYALLASRSLAERVVSTLGLVDDAAFNSGAPPTFWATLKASILGDGGRKQASASEQTPVESSEPPANDYDQRVRGTIDHVKSIVSIAPVPNTSIVRLTASHPNADVAQRVANGYAEVFIADSLDRRYEASTYARKFLEERLQQLKVKLEESEKQLVRYAEKSGIVRLDDKKSLIGSDLEALNTKLTEARSERVRLELLWQRAQTTKGIGLQQYLDSGAVQDIRKARTELSAEYEQKLSLFKPAYPAMVQLRNQIEELDRQLELEIKAIRDSIKVNFEAAKKQEELLSRQFAQIKTELVDQRNRSIEYNIIEREVDTNRTLYDGLLQRYKEIGVAGGVGTNNVSIVDRATLPLAPNSGGLQKKLLIALMVGLMIGAAGALGLDYLDDSFKLPEDIERETGMAVLGVVPAPRRGASIEVELTDPRSSIAEAFRSLRTGLQFATSEGLPKSLLVTSSRPAEGKSTTTLSLAQVLADINLRVLLIDADLRNSSLHKTLNCSNEVGLSNYLTGAKLPEEVVQSTGHQAITLISSGPLPPNPVELLSGPKFMALLTLAAQSFDIVMIDGPPVMGLADAPLIASTVEATLFVVAAHETRRRTLKVAHKRLQFARAHIIGATLTKFNSGISRYGSDYGYGGEEYHSYGVKQISARQT